MKQQLTTPKIKGRTVSRLFISKPYKDSETEIEETAK